MIKVKIISTSIERGHGRYDKSPEEEINEWLERQPITTKIISISGTYVPIPWKTNEDFGHMHSYITYEIQNENHNISIHDLECTDNN